MAQDGSTGTPQTYHDIRGTGGADWINSDPTDVLAVGEGGIAIAQEETVFVSMGTASYALDHAVFAVALDPNDSSVVGIDFLWTSSQGEVDDLAIQMNAGEVLAFGILVDGAGLNNLDDLGDGTLSLVTDDAGGTVLMHTNLDGASTTLAGEVRLSTTPNTANGTLFENSNTIQIGFEDGHGGDDGDFDDLTFAMTVSDATVQGLQDLGAVSSPDFIQGLAGADVLTGGGQPDLIAGGGAGGEWQFVNGEWRYDASQIPDPEGNPHPIELDEDDDVLIGGDGDDVLLGNRGNDILRGGHGDDTLNGGRGHDALTGGEGADILNLEDGDDMGIGGDGADIINAGAGADTLYGDLFGQDLLVSAESDDPAEVSGWIQSQDVLDGKDTLSQTVQTTPGHTYTFSVDLSANLANNSAAGTVEVLWDGQVLAETTVEGAIAEKLEVTFQADGDEGLLEIRTEAAPSDDIDASSAVATIDTSAQTADGDQAFLGFAPGQSHLYQVLNGQLTRLDPSTGDYLPIGDDPGFRTNSIGFNTENNLIYGVSNQAGTDASGNAVGESDLVIYDATGAVHRVGEVSHKDVVGDFDGSGNLWTFDKSLDRITKIDVQNIEPDGTVSTTDYLIDAEVFPFRIYDLTFDAASQTFIGVKGASEDGEVGMVVQIDVSTIEDGGDPILTTHTIDAVIYDGQEIPGVPKGSFGAAFSDGDGNVYVGLNRGNHDLDADSPIQGAIYHLKQDADTGSLKLEYIAQTSMTTTNDGAMDSRGTNPFGGVDATVDVTMEDMTLVANTGGDDKLRGGDGDDLIFGGGGADIIHAGAHNDSVSGDQGRDVIFGGSGYDQLFGGAADDHLDGGLEDDFLFGGVGQDVLMGREGADSLTGGYGDDAAFGGQGDDVLALDSGADRGFGGLGNDTLNGGDGNDHLEGGAGDDVVQGDAGSDFVKGADGHDVLRGGAGDDRGYGGAGADTLFGGTGVDTMIGNADDDLIFGNADDDILKGGSGDDTIDGGADNDMVFGGTGSDALDGGAGADRVVGGSGADTIRGGAGEDHLWGGSFIQDNAADIFVYAQGDGKDMIHDFEANLDRIDLSSYGMTFEELQNRITDLGWAAEIDLSDLAADGAVDRIILRSIDLNDLQEDNFIF